MKLDIYNVNPKVQNNVTIKNSNGGSLENKNIVTTRYSDNNSD